MEYVLVANIPAEFHSSDLRGFFSEFVETSKFSCFHFRHRPQEEFIQPTSVTHPENTKKKPLCCIVRLKDSVDAAELVKRYHLRNWVDSDDNDLPSKCAMIRIELNTAVKTIEKQALPLSKQSLNLVLPSAVILDSVELKPPALMPQGNVGTPTKHFLGLIQKCQLPSQLISKLGLRFPKTRTRKYGSVPFDYGTGTEVDGEEDDEEYSQIPRGSREEPVAEEAEESEEEEWERHEALHDDITEQERTKERLYEEEEEVVWEKGGPGIVWYTDAQLWREAEGDFDEQTADDWDVDYSAYHEEGAGDKDARDMLEMRRSDMWREGKNVDVFKFPAAPRLPTSKKGKQVKPGSVGCFERHTRGVGRTLMERFGWKEGQGLGKSVKGIVNPVESEGQLPKEKKGLGYRGENLNHFTFRKRSRRDPHDVIISTVYDNPSNNDPEESLIERNPSTYLKYRKS